jgi:hypothetical protein
MDTWPSSYVMSTGVVSVRTCSSRALAMISRRPSLGSHASKRSSFMLRSNRRASVEVESVLVSLIGITDP